MSLDNKTPIPCVGVICFRGDDVLLIRRGKPPRQGEWSIPGGRIEPGESEEDAVLRELFEETGIRAMLMGKIETIPAQFGETRYMLHDYLVIWTSGEPVAGDDACEALFADPQTLDTIPMWAKTHDIIAKGRRMKKAFSSDAELA